MRLAVSSRPPLARGALFALARRLSTAPAHSEACKRASSVLFFGSDDFAVETLRVLRTSATAHAAAGTANTNVSTASQSDRAIGHIEVICPPDKPAGRGLKLSPVPVKVFANENGIPVHHGPAKKGVAAFAEWKMPTLATSANGKFDFGIVVSFGRLLPAFVIDGFNVGAINLHPSLLPRYRGAAPLHRVILGGDAITGVSVIRLAVDAFDSGRVLLQRRVLVHPCADFDALHDQLVRAGSLAVLEATQRFDELWPRAWQQNEEGVTHAPKVSRGDGVVCDWAKETVATLHRKYRALGNAKHSHASEGVHTTFLGKSVRLWDVRPDSLEMAAIRRSHLERLVNDPEFDAYCAEQKADRATVLERLSTQWAAEGAGSACSLSEGQLAAHVPGDVVFDKGRGVLMVRCADGWVLVSGLQFERKQPMTAHDFQNSYGQKMKKEGKQPRFESTGIAVASESAPGA